MFEPPAGISGTVIYGTICISSRGVNRITLSRAADQRFSGTLTIPQKHIAIE